MRSTPVGIRAARWEALPLSGQVLPKAGVTDGPVGQQTHRPGKQTFEPFFQLEKRAGVGHVGAFIKLNNKVEVASFRVQILTHG